MSNLWVSNVLAAQTNQQYLKHYRWEMAIRILAYAPHSCWRSQPQQIVYYPAAYPLRAVCTRLKCIDLLGYFKLRGYPAISRSTTSRVRLRLISQEYSELMQRLFDAACSGRIDSIERLIESKSFWSEKIVAPICFRKEYAGFRSFKNTLAPM